MDERRARLTAERAAAAGLLESMSVELDAVVAAAAGSNVDDEHDPEGSTIAFEREQLATLRAQARQRLRAVDAAVARLDDGRYGTCEACGEAIGDARLEALPATRRCVACARRSARSARPE